MVLLVSILLLFASLYFISLSNYLNILDYSPVNMGFMGLYYALFYLSVVFGVLSGVLLVKGKYFKGKK